MYTFRMVLLILLTAILTTLVLYQSDHEPYSASLPGTKWKQTYDNNDYIQFEFDTQNRVKKIQSATEQLLDVVYNDMAKNAGVMKFAGAPQHRFKIETQQNGVDVLRVYETGNYSLYRMVQN